MAGQPTGCSLSRSLGSTAGAEQRLNRNTMSSSRAPQRKTGKEGDVLAERSSSCASSGSIFPLVGDYVLSVWIGRLRGAPPLLRCSPTGCTDRHKNRRQQAASASSKAASQPASRPPGRPAGEMGRQLAQPSPQGRGDGAKVTHFLFLVPFRGEELSSHLEFMPVPCWYNSRQH